MAGFSGAHDHTDVLTFSCQSTRWLPSTDQSITALAMGVEWLRGYKIFEILRRYELKFDNISIASLPCINCLGVSEKEIIDFGFHSIYQHTISLKETTQFSSYIGVFDTAVLN